MITDHLRRLAGLRSAVLGMGAASLLVLAVAAPAMATPKGDFAVFAQCPLSNPSVNLCVFVQSSGGEFIIGNKTVPVNKTITLQGGSILNEETGAETFVAAANGETLSKTPLTVPGGLLGIKAPTWWPKEWQEWFNKQINEGFTGVTATAELVGNPGISRTNLLFQEGVALSLPVRLHLNNQILGSSCYLGSKSNPVTFNLTTGTTNPPKPNTPIKGAVGELEFKDEFQLVIIKGNKVVDNAFSAPGTEGCGGFLSFFINPLVEKILGVPSAAGHNTAILEGSLQNATAAAVKASE
ncbi:MAG TPA: hypothetical protein VGY76_00585 [Solirubrobacteraceae bacterium]|jgi:hypothetical protein|nr:hypothetical protein [Solirubrobacteraceae bacterium]